MPHTVKLTSRLPSIDAFGSDAQKEKFLPRLAKGEIVGCFVSPEARNSRQGTRADEARG